MDEQRTRFKQDCDAGFEAVYAAYYRRLVYFATGIINDRQEAEDIAAEIFLKYWNKRHDFNTEKNTRAFLFISTKNACITLLRQRRKIKIRQEDFAMQQSSHTESILQDMVLREMFCEAKDVLQTLPKGCRRIIRLTFEAGQSNRQIAALLALSVNTVSNQKSRGIKILKERFAKLQTV